MKKNDMYTSIIWGTLGLYIASQGYRLNLGTLRSPGSGFLIFWAGVTLSALSIALFILAVFSKKKEEEKILWRGLQWSGGIKLMVSLIVYVLVFKWMGFLLSTFMLLLYLFKGLEPQKWRIAFIFSTTTIILCYLVFTVFLEVNFPEGILGKIINFLH